MVQAAFGVLGRATMAAVLVTGPVACSSSGAASPVTDTASPTSGMTGGFVTWAWAENTDAPCVVLDQVLHDRQAEARAASLGTVSGGVDSVETIEDERQVIGADPVSGVGDGQFNVIA
jgi:hypothetical protein